MSSETALGLLETQGLVAAIEGADAMVKAAHVKLLAKELSTGGMVTILITGETGAVKSALQAGASAAEKVGSLLGTHIIPRPDHYTSSMVGQLLDDGAGKPDSPAGQELDSLTVTELRRRAREKKDLGLSGREISSADKETLLQLLKNS